jgi:hypothetical protein
MDGRNEERVAIKFCFKASLSATETLVLVQKAYGNEALNRSNVFRCYSRFRDGREPVENDKRDGRPKSTRTEVNIASVAELVKNDRRIVSRMITESLNIPKTVVLRILKEDLRKRKLCAPCVPYYLTPEQREDRVTFCQDIIVMADADKIFLTKLLRETRAGVLPMTPKQSDRVLNGLVRHPLGRRNLNVKGPASRPCWHFFFDSQGGVDKKFVSEGKTVNAEFCKGVMDRPLKRIQWVRPALFCSRDFFLLHDNAPPYKTASDCEF